MMMVCQRIERQGALIPKEHFCAVVSTSLKFQFRVRILSCSTIRGVKVVSVRIHNAYVLGETLLRGSCKENEKAISNYYFLK